MKSIMRSLRSNNWIEEVACWGTCCWWQDSSFFGIVAAIAVYVVDDDDMLGALPLRVVAGIF